MLLKRQNLFVISLTKNLDSTITYSNNSSRCFENIFKLEALAKCEQRSWGMWHNNKVLVIDDNQSRRHDFKILLDFLSETTLVTASDTWQAAVA
jgi:hypothetical protein